MTPINLNNSYAAMTLATPAATTIAAGDTPVKAAGTFAAGEKSTDFTVAATNRITYDGATLRKCMVNVAATLAAASGTNQELEVSIYKYDASASSGAVIAATKVSNLAAATTGVYVGTNAVVELDTGDYIELWVANVTGTPNITVDHATVSVIGFQA